MRLHDLQEAMRDTILGETTSALAGLIEGDGIGTEERLRIYRNNSLFSLTDALTATYPVVCRLVDERFFRFAADRFIHRHPPAAPDLAGYGSAFGDFLSDFPPARPLAYLPDVARLEWALSTAFFAPDPPPLAAACLAAIPPDRYPALAFELHPACRLLTSPFPVDRIWLANQPNATAEAAVDLADGGCHLLVHRRDTLAEFVPLSPAGFAFAAALGDGATLQRAYDAAAGIEPAFDLITALHQHLHRGSFVGFQIAQDRGGGA